MKLASFVILSGTAQAITQQQLKNFNTRSGDALDACNLYMERALTCQPPKRKIPKYTHRLQAVMNDALHHMRIGKCEAPGRRRRRRDLELIGNIETDDIYDFTTAPLTTMTMSEGDDDVTVRQSEWITAGKFSDKLDLHDFGQTDETPDRLITEAPSDTGLQGRIDRQNIRFNDEFDRIDNPRGLGFFNDKPEPGAESTAGDHHRMEFGLFDGDFQDNIDESVDRNLDSMFDDQSEDIKEDIQNIQENERGYSNKGMSKLEAKCRRQTRDLFYGQLLKNCKKISGWKRRVDHLLDDLTRMRKTCTKME